MFIRRIVMVYFSHPRIAFALGRRLYRHHRHYEDDEDEDDEGDLLAVVIILFMAAVCLALSVWQAGRLCYRLFR